MHNSKNKPNKMHETYIKEILQLTDGHKRKSKQKEIHDMFLGNLILSLSNET